MLQLHQELREPGLFEVPQLVANHGDALLALQRAASLCELAAAILLRHACDRTEQLQNQCESEFSDCVGGRRGCVDDANAEFARRIAN